MIEHTQTLVDNLGAFIQQPDRAAFLLACSDADVVVPAKLLASRDRDQEDELLLAFPLPCPSASAYVDGIVGQLRLQLEAAQGQLAEDGLDPWPDLPASACDPRRAPAKRLRELIDWAASVVPEPDVIVWALLPSEIGKREDYLAMVAPLLPLEGHQPWMERHRLIVRDLVPDQPLAAAFRERGCFEAYTMRIDFSTAATLDDLCEQAADPSRPSGERVMAALQLAATDMAHGRLDEATAKYELCYRYYDAESEGLGRALALCGLGDVHVRKDEHHHALARYRQSLAISVPEELLPCTLNALLGAAASAERVEEWDEAEGYWEFANRVAGKLFNPMAKCDALARIGRLRWRRGARDEAIEAWTNGRKLASEAPYPERERELDALLDEAQQALAG